MKPIRVDLACNDPDNGAFAGTVWAVSIGSAEFTSRAWDWGPKLVVGNGWIRFGGMKLPCSQSKYGVGNWCWNGYWLEPSDVERLINWAKFRKWFDVEEAPHLAFEAYKAGKPLRFFSKEAR